MANPVIDPTTGERIPDVALGSSQGVQGTVPQIDPSTGERIPASPGTPDTRNGVQRFVDNLTTVTPAEQQTPSWMPAPVGAALNQAQKFGAGAIQGATAPFVHPVQTVEGIGNLIAHPVDTVKAAASSAASNPAQTLGNVVGGAVLAGGAGEAGSAAADAISDAMPAAQKARAAGLLQSVAHDANQVPVQLNNAGDAASDLMDWQKKTQLGPTVNKFLNRITDPKQGPLTYEDARDYYQLLGRMSVNESTKLAPAVQRDLTRMVVGLKQDIGDAADTVGRAQDYYQGIGDYAQASKYQDWLDDAKDFVAKQAIPAAAKGVGAAGAGGAAYGLWKYLTGK